MKRYIFLLIIICTLSRTSSGQTNCFYGQVLDYCTKLPIQYVNIGIEGKNIGTVSDSTGFYSLNISQDHFNETIVFSIIGYEPFRISISNLNKSGGSVFLKQTSIELNEIVISPKKTPPLTFGIKGNNYICYGYNNAEKGSEIGTLLHSDSKILLTGCEIGFVKKIMAPGYKFRINVYSIKENMFTNILGEMIITGSEDLVQRDNGSFYLELQKYGIVIEGDFLIAIEKIEENADLFLYAKKSGPKSYYRKASMGSWNIGRYSVGIRVFAQDFI